VSESPNTRPESMSESTPGESSAHATAARTDHETTYHPAFETSQAAGLPAGKVLLVVLVAMLVAGLLNSGWMVRTAEGMRPGLGRTMVTTVAVPVDFVATKLALDRPRQGIDVALGRTPASAGADEIELVQPSNDSAELAVAGAVVPPIHTAPVRVAHPTVAKPLNVLVLGDSLSIYTGQRLQELLLQKHLGKVKVTWRNGTGLATPQFFNWPAWAKAQIQATKPQAVFVLLGGNDNQDMQRKSQYFARGTPEWQAEYQRRVGVVMQSIIEQGVDRVYWSGPPTAKKANDNGFYHQLNLAAAKAAPTVPGARYIDLAGPTSLNGQWLDVLAFNNEAFNARMGDGFHWSWRAAQITSRLWADAMAKDYGPLYDR